MINFTHLVNLDRLSYQEFDNIYNIIPQMKKRTDHYYLFQEQDMNEQYIYYLHLVANKEISYTVIWI